MDAFINILKVLVAIILLTIGFNNISAPSDLQVGIGAVEIMLGLLIIYRPAKAFIKNI